MLIYSTFLSLVSFLSINIFNHFYAKSTKLGNMETIIYEISQTDSKLNGFSENNIISYLLQLRETGVETMQWIFLYHSLLNTWIWGLVQQGWLNRKVGEFTGWEFISGKGFSEIRSIPHLTHKSKFEMYWRSRFKHDYKHYPRKKCKRTP